MTPYQLKIACRAHEKNKEFDIKMQEEEFHALQKIMTMQAYQISRWVWQKRINIKSILQDMDSGKKKSMTDKEMLAQVQAINANLGGEVKKNGKK